jgi:hypothetical protein
MRRHLLSTATIAAFALTVAGCAAQADRAAPGTDQQADMAAAGGDRMAEMAPPGGDYQMVSELVALPEFIPGLGSLYVQPATLPAGPFLAYDRNERLVSTIYMIPLEDIEAQKGFDDLAVGGESVESVDLYYNAGHPGVEAPHYHIVLWHVPKDDAALE